MSHTLATFRYKRRVWSPLKGTNSLITSYHTSVTWPKCILHWYGCLCLFMTFNWTDTEIHYKNHRNLKEKQFSFSRHWQNVKETEGPGEKVLSGSQENKHNCLHLNLSLPFTNNCWGQQTWLAWDHATRGGWFPDFSRNFVDVLILCCPKFDR